MLTYLLVFLMINTPVVAPSAPAPDSSLEPERSCSLPGELFEVSGLTEVDNHTVACVQDELGIIYFYDLDNCAITGQVNFETSGDFEGLTRVGDKMFALRSDGSLYEVSDLKSKKPAVKPIETDIPVENSEGLCFDEVTQRLLIAPKMKYFDEDYGKAYRAIYGYDLQTGKMLAEPVLELSVKTVQDFLEKQAGIALPKKKKSGETKFQFQMSSIAVHPDQQSYLLLLSSDHLMLQVDRKGNMLKAFSLDEQRFPKPEGVTFLPDRSLIISSEGEGDGSAVIAKFKAF